MFTAAIPREQREACMCESFGSNLQVPAFQWYTNLPNNLISSFAQLIDTFVEQFASSNKLEKLSGDLYRIQQRRTESLWDYVRHFNKETVSIPFCNQETAVDAFWKWLFPDGEFYKDLAKFNCSAMEDVLARAWTKIRWEDNELHHVCRSTSNESCYEDRHPKRTFQGPDWQPTSHSTSRSSEPYFASPHHGSTNDNRHPLDRPPVRSNECPPTKGDQARIPKYTLSVEPIKWVAIMKTITTRKEVKSNIYK